jgi:hypothetical protein
MTQIWQVALELQVCEEAAAAAGGGEAQRSGSVGERAVAAALRAACVVAEADRDVEAEAVLRRARACFEASGNALRAGPAAAGGLGRAMHSSYQRQMGNALVALRHMHVMEDVSSGACGASEVGSLRGKLA